MNLRLPLSLAALLVALSAQAQTLTGLRVDTPAAMPGRPVAVTVVLDAADTINCGLRVDWGDGAGNDYKITGRDNIPLKASHAYARPGDYTVTAQPKRVTTHLGCVGGKQSAMVKVQAPAVAAKPAPAPAAASAMASCPEGWKLNPKTVNRKTGAFTCTAKAGTAIAGSKVNCPGDLTYFENSKKGQLGCRP